MLEFKQLYGVDGAAAALPVLTATFGKIEEDGFDAAAWHIVGYDAGVLIGAARLRRVGDGVFAIDRVAVKDGMRGEYIGDLMMKTLQDKAVSEGGYMTTVTTPAKTRGFFEKLGYELSGAAFADGEAVMRKDLTKVCRSCCEGKCSR